MALLTPAVHVLCYCQAGALSPFLSDPELDKVAKHKLDHLSSGALRPDIARSYVQGVGTLSKCVGYRFGRHLSTAVPLVMKYGQKAAEGDDELREFALQVGIAHSRVWLLPVQADCSDHIAALPPLPAK